VGNKLKSIDMFIPHTMPIFALLLNTQRENLVHYWELFLGVFIMITYRGA